LYNIAYCIQSRYTYSRSTRRIDAIALMYALRISSSHFAHNTHGVNSIQGIKKPFLCPDGRLLSEGGQSLNSIFADCFVDWLIGIPFVGDDVVAKSISKLH